MSACRDPDMDSGVRGSLPDESLLVGAAAQLPQVQVARHARTPRSGADLVKHEVLELDERRAEAKA